MLLRAAVLEFGPNGARTDNLFITDAAGGVTIAAAAATVPVGNGWSLCFQKQYREYWIEPGGRGSFSRMMTPDVSMIRERSGETKECLIILDAKYRIDEGLNAALNSIHTYRDALVQEVGNGTVRGIVSAAYLLTPYISEIAEKYKDTPLPGRLFHPKFRTDFHFGAVTLRPGMDLGELRSTLLTIIADSGV
jgi:hypothetical protein